MAVISTPIACDLVLVMDNGVGASGQALLSTGSLRMSNPTPKIRMCTM